MFLYNPNYSCRTNGNEAPNEHFWDDYKIMQSVRRKLESSSIIKK